MSSFAKWNRYPWPWYKRCRKVSFRLRLLGCINSSNVGLSFFRPSIVSLLLLLLLGLDMAGPCGLCFLCGGKVGFYALGAGGVAMRSFVPLARCYAVPLGDAVCSRGEGQHPFLSLGESDPCLSLVVGKREKFGDVLWSGKVAIACSEARPCNS